MTQSWIQSCHRLWARSWYLCGTSLIQFIKIDIFQRNIAPIILQRYSMGSSGPFFAQDFLTGSTDLLSLRAVDIPFEF